MGITGPNVLMVHCVYLSESDLRKAEEYSLKVSHNPVSNMYLASGVAPVGEMLKHGITVSLGVDGAASNNGQDMIRDEGGRLSVGAAVTLTELLNSRAVRDTASLLWQSASHAANRQVRNRATLAGNLANACPASDCIPALMVLGASVTAQGPEGRREIPLRELFRSCEACLRHAGMQVRTCYFLETATKKLTLRPGELIVSVEVPKQPTEERSLFYKLTENQSAGMAVLNFAMWRWRTGPRPES